jgi:hypothetical protein
MNRALSKRMSQLEAEQSTSPPRVCWHDAVPDDLEEGAELVMVSWQGELDDDDA